MSEEHLRAFLEAVSVDPVLKQTLKAARDSDSVVAMAARLGFKISKEDLQNTRTNLLSDYDLELAAGGAGCQLYGSLTNTQAAYCTSKECPTECETPVC